MPLFGQKKNSNSDQRRKSGAMAHNGMPTENLANLEAPPTLPPPPAQEPIQPMETKSLNNSVVTSRKELVFHSQLAHGSATREIKDFSNVKELYQKLVDAFGLAPNEIIFCTLNTHKVDMSRLLGAQIGLEDFIFAHVKGTPKFIQINKTDPSLGLTITDNGAGFSFVKRVREGSLVSRFPEVCVGDMIESINGRSMLGSRHYEVAKLLKELPQFTELSLSLVEPKKAFDAIGPRSKGGATVATVMDGDTRKLEQAVAKTEGRATLKMKRDGVAVVEEVKAWESKAAELVDDRLESFMGIRDTELAQTMVDMAKGKTDHVEFSLAMQDQLGEFEFPEDFVSDVWTVVGVTRGTSL